MKTPAPKSLSDKELLIQIEKIRRREHLSTIDILLHLNEVERRQLHLKLGYSSLYDYCVKHLRYSSSGASRRVAVARCIRRHPEVLDLLRSQKLNVTGVSLVASVLREDNKTELLHRMQDKTQREIDAIAARYRPPIAFRDRVKPVRVAMSERRVAAHEDRPAAQEALATPRLEAPERRVAAQEASEKSALEALEGACEKSNYAHNGQSRAVTDYKTTGNESEDSPAVRTEQKMLVQFLTGPEFMKKYEKVRALLSQRLLDTSFENVFGFLIEAFLDHHCPARRKVRRDNRKVKEQSRKKRRAAPASRQGERRSPSRRIPVAVRDKVYARDKGRCTYVSRTGKRCGSTQALQIDHIKPFARGGANVASNLRVLCAKHNRLAAQEVFGEYFAKRSRRRE